MILAGMRGGREPFEIRISQGQLVAPKSDEGGRVALARRTKLGEDGNQM
jgi:hypothetical protein